MRNFSLILVAALTLTACEGPIVTTTAWQDPGKEELQGSYWLPVVKYPLNITRKKCVIAMQVAKPDYYPDPSYRYVLHYEPNAFTSDDAVLGTDENGLLQTANASSEPQVSAIIGKAFEIIADLAKFQGTPPIPCDPDKDPDIDITFPLNPAALVDQKPRQDAQEAIQERLSAGPVVGAFTVTPSGGGDTAPADGDSCTYYEAPDKSKPDGTNKDGTTKYKTDIPGVCYRIARPYDVTIMVSEAVKGKGGQTENRQYVLSSTLMAPDPSRAYYVALNRGIAKTDIKLTFSHGLLTKYENVHPSTALAVLGFPADVLKGIIGLEPSSSSAASTKK